MGFDIRSYKEGMKYKITSYSECNPDLLFEEVRESEQYWNDMLPDSYKLRWDVHSGVVDAEHQYFFGIGHSSKKESSI